MVNTNVNKTVSRNAADTTMWEKLSSSGYFFKIEFSRDGKDISYCLTNVKKIWKEKEITNFSEVCKRVKVGQQK